MTNPMSCDTARDLFFELRHGRIEKPQHDAFDDHIADCTSCREYVEKLDSMLDEAMLWEPADAVAIDKNNLFDSIVTGIDNEKNGVVVDEISPVSDNGPGQQDPNEPLDYSGHKARRAVPWMRVFLAAAALIVATMSWPLLIVEFMSGESDALFKELAATDGDIYQENGGLDLDLPFELSKAPLFADSTSVSDSVRVLPGDNARWAMEADGKGWEVVAHSGQVLVEFLPRDGETLNFRYPGGQGSVVGTVFYLDADTSEVGVVEGEVNVESDDGKSATLHSRNAWRGEEIHEIGQEQWETLTASINPETHRQKLAELREKLALDQKEESEEESAEKPAEQAEAPVQPAAAQTKPAHERVPGPAGLRLNAEKALRQRDFQNAARQYEALLEVLPADDRSAGSVRLDLARLYHRHLQDPGKTADHLRYFIQTWPDDTVTPQAIAELCRLVDEPDQEPHCRRR